MNFSKSLFKYIRYQNLRSISLVRKTKKEIITKDELLIKPVIPKEFLVPSIEIKPPKRITTFYDFYCDKSIEGLALTDERFGQLITTIRSTDTNLFILEGINHIRDAIRMGGNMKHLYFTQRSLLKEIPFVTPSSNCLVNYITYKNLKKMSQLKTPPGILGVFERPNSEDLLSDPYVSRKMPLTLILDNIRDPGNLGTIIRTSAAFNIYRILLTKGCVNLYNEKVIRSCLSAIINIPVFPMTDWSEIRNVLHPDIQVHMAEMISSDYSFEDRPHLTSFKYYDDHVIDFTKNNPYALIIGGENSGISDSARKLVEETKGFHLYIPVVESIGCLNSGIAASIVLSEFQRRFLNNK